MPTLTVRDVAQAVAGHGLPGSQHAFPERPLGDGQWQGLLAAVHDQRLSGLLVQAITRGDLPVTDVQVDQASDAHWEAVCGTLSLESTLLHVIDVLTGAGVASRVLKGSAVAHLDYEHPETRLFGDNDILVRGDQFDQAVRVLGEDGNRRRFPEPRPGFDRRFSKGTSFDTPAGHDIDLHRTFVMGPYGLRLNTEDLWLPARHFLLAGRQLAALDDTARFLHACFHAALGNLRPRLVPQRDVAQMALRSGFDTGAALDLARRWRAEPVVARAVALSWDTFRLADVTALSAWATRYHPDAQALRELAVYSDPKGSYAAKSLAAVRAIPSLREKVAFVRALVMPKGDYVRDRHTSAMRRLASGVSAVLRSGT